MATEIGRWKGLPSADSIIRRFLSDELNPLVNGSMVALHTPLPGYIVGTVNSCPIWSVATGTYTTAATLKVGNNVAHDNLLAAFGFPATTSFVPGTNRTRGANIGFNRTGTEMLDLNTPAVIEVTGSTGVGTGTIRLRFITTFVLIPITDIP